MDSPVRVRIDLNRYDDDGETVIARLSRTEGVVIAGDAVTAYEPEEGLRWEGTVVRVRPEFDQIFLDVDWDSCRDDIEEQSTVLPRPHPARHEVDWRSRWHFIAEPSHPAELLSVGQPGIRRREHSRNGKSLFKARAFT